MKNMIKYTTIAIVALLSISLFPACSVHQWPSDTPERMPFLLHINFNTDLPLYQEIEASRANGTKAPTDGHDMRYIINAYRTDKERSESRVADTTFVFTNTDLSNLDFTAPLELYEGTYTFRVWADYVDPSSKKDKYYDTEDFAEIILASKNNHPGSNDYRDAFRGYVTASVISPNHYTSSMANQIDNQATVEMVRPMGKYKFISTDVDRFILHVAQMMAAKGELANEDLDYVADLVKEISAQQSGSSTKGDNDSGQNSDGKNNGDGPNASDKDIWEQLLSRIDITQFKILFRYNVFMPCSFNMFTDKPADSWMGMTYTSTMKIEADKEVSLGFDYIFVNGTETTLSISVEVYDKDGELLSSSNPVMVPIVRSKLTVIKGAFLTTKASGGVTINPSFDGDDYNVEIL